MQFSFSVFIIYSLYLYCVTCIIYFSFYIWYQSLMHGVPKYMPKTHMMELIKSKEGSVGLSYPMLTRSNYTAWSLNMRVFMQAHEIWGAVVPTDTKVMIEEKTYKVALAAIFQAIPEACCCAYQRKGLPEIHVKR